MVPPPSRALAGSPRALLWLALLAALAWNVADREAGPAKGADGAQVVELAPPAEAEWIWAPGEPEADQRVTFSGSFGIDRPMRVVGGDFTADNGFELSLGGELLASGDDWASPVALGEGPELAAGEHLLSVEAWNEGGPAGLLGRLVLEDEEGRQRVVVTDADWWSMEVRPEGEVPRIRSEQVHSFGPASNHSGPWGPVLAPRVAPDAADITVAEGFVVERLYSAREADGSWASMTWGPGGRGGGRLFVSPQSGSLMVFEPSDELLAGAPAIPRVAPLGGGSHAAGLGQPRSLAHLPVHAAQGLEWAHDSLYVSVSSSIPNGGGLWRARDTDGDDRLDAAEQLVAYAPYSEHGAHGVRLLPDGDLVLVQGNYATGPQQVEGRPALELDLTPTAHVQEDVLLPRIWDPRGHAHDVFAPGGELWRFDPDGVRWTRESVGMRNAYDIAVSSAGEVFTYDSDMEWDHGTPWYRSPAVYHLVPGADFGWRSGTAKWPREYPDSLPVVCETDLSSPTGVELGEAGRFGAPWDQALFLGDWAWGRILAVHMEPFGATYRGEPEVFLEGRGVTITDLEFGPDGNLWFVTGGRGTQSGLYRVRPVGGTSGEAGKLASTGAHERRRELETSGLPDDFLYHDLRMAGPFQGAALRAGAAAMWKAMREPGVLPDVVESDRPPPQPDTLDLVEVALAQVLHDPEGLGRPPFGPGNPGVPAMDRIVPYQELPEPDGTLATRSARAKVLDEAMLRLRVAMLLELRVPELAAEHHVSWQAQLAEALGAAPVGASSGDEDIALWRATLAEALGKDASSDLERALLDRERARLAVAIDTPGLPALLVPRAQAPHPPEHRLHFLLLLRLVDDGWTPELRRDYFRALFEARSFQGGASIGGFVAEIEEQALARCSEAERLELTSFLADLEARAAAADTTPPLTALPKLRTWTTSDAVSALDATPAGDPIRGADLFRTVGCAACHRVDGVGGALGPDLTAAGRRFARPDLVRAIVEPAADRSDQYGLVVMPDGLLDVLDAAGLADLFAFLEAPR